MSTSHSPLVGVIAGARPNFMKIAPILRAIRQRQAAGSRLRFRLVHTGQHYDARMSGDFFTQLGTPEPDVNLEVGSGMQEDRLFKRPFPCPRHPEYGRTGAEHSARRA